MQPRLPENTPCHTPAKQPRRTIYLNIRETIQRDTRIHRCTYEIFQKNRNGRMRSPCFMRVCRVCSIISVSHFLAIINNCHQNLPMARTNNTCPHGGGGAGENRRSCYCVLVQSHVCCYAPCIVVPLVQAWKRAYCELLFYAFWGRVGSPRPWDDRGDPMGSESFIDRRGM